MNDLLEWFYEPLHVTYIRHQTEKHRMNVEQTRAQLDDGPPPNTLKNTRWDGSYSIAEVRKLVGK